MLPTGTCSSLGGSEVHGSPPNSAPGRAIIFHSSHDENQEQPVYHRDTQLNAATLFFAVTASTWSHLCGGNRRWLVGHLCNIAIGMSLRYNSQCVNNHLSDSKCSRLLQKVLRKRKRYPKEMKARQTALSRELATKTMDDRYFS